MSEILKISSVIKQDLKKVSLNKEETINLIKKNKKFNAYTSIVDNYTFFNKESCSPLFGIPYAVKDNINVEGTITTGGSLFLKNYISPYSAHLIKLLDKVGAIPVVKTNMDEFGLGGDGIYSAYGDVINPFDNTRITGGSSSGSAVLVAKKLIPFSIATDTGDSIRRPASLLGIFGFKPTYGLISRYGVFPYAPSLDHVGILANNIYDIALVSDVIVSHDEKDFTSQKIDSLKFIDTLSNFKDEDFKKYKICVIQNILDFASKKVQNEFLKLLKDNDIKFNLENLELDIIKLIPLAYKIISYSEAVSCYQNLTGITFGEKSNKKNYQEKIKDIRSKNLGFELKKRFIFGAYCTSEENYESIFLKSEAIRNKIVGQAKKIFLKYDFIIMPGSSSIAPLIKDVKAKKATTNLCDDYLQIANFGGFPSITIPALKIDKNFVGINICGKINSDNLLLAFANSFFKKYSEDI